jgi:hypothetical protein
MCARSALPLPAALTCARTVTLLYTVFGKAYKMLKKFDVPAAPGDRQQMATWMPKITEMVRMLIAASKVLAKRELQVRNGEVKANPVKLWPGGLSAIPDGLEYLRQGKASGEKIVYALDT